MSFGGAMQNSKLDIYLLGAQCQVPSPDKITCFTPELPFPLNSNKFYCFILDLWQLQISLRLDLAHGIIMAAEKSTKQC